MSSPAISLSALSARQIVLARLFAAPADIVFRAFTSPEHVIHGWGPFMVKGWQGTHEQLARYLIQGA